MLIYVLIDELVITPEPIFSDKSLMIDFLLKMLYFACLFLAHFIKQFTFKKGLINKPFMYFANNLVWFSVISFSIVFVNGGLWLYAALVIPIAVTGLKLGTRDALIATACSFVIHVSMTAVNHLSRLNAGGFSPGNYYDIFLEFVFLYIIFAMFSILFGRIQKLEAKNVQDNINLTKELEDKYFQLEIAQDEIRLQYDKLKVTNKKLEETNLKLSASIAEFYTLQQVSKAINSILDTRELMEYVNDIIIGVMGVNNSSIIISDDKTKRLKLNITNIANAEDRALLADNLNTEFFKSLIQKGGSVIENYADPLKYPFIDNRDVYSFICVPLKQKDRILGLVLVEHKYTNAFIEDNVRLLEIIAQQVGIVMENAVLYQKMQDLANRDGLTGAYNRQYFKGQLELEFKMARDEGYPLSLAIFDIDLFKRFNDTYGHMFGDLVIVSVYQVVSGYLRKHDVIARYGGEEFIIIFPRTNLEQAYEKIEALRKLISEYVIRDNLVAASVTASFGVCSYPECVLSEIDLVRIADDALYTAKESGRNCACVARKLLD